MSGFGGVLPHARHSIVEVEGWLDDREFAEILAQGQLIPGPNIVNIAAMLGTRFRGWRGAVAALAGILGPAFFIFLALGMAYSYLLGWAWLQKSLVGIAAVAAGLTAATGIKLGRTMAKRVWAPLIALAATIAVLVLHISLGWVVLVLGVFGALCAWQWPEARAVKGGGQ